MKVALIVVVGSMLVSMLGAVAPAGATELCSTNTSPCAGTMYKGGTSLSAKSAVFGSSEFTTSSGTIRCEKTSFGGETRSTGEANGLSMEIRVGKLVFSSCTEVFGTSCTVTTLNLPWRGTVIRTMSGSGTMSLFHELAAGNPAFSVKCGSLIDCILSSTNFSLSVTGGTPAEFKATGVPLLREGKLCPSEASWDGEYELIEPSPLFVV